VREREKETEREREREKERGRASERDGETERERQTHTQREREREREREIFSHIQISLVHLFSNVHVTIISHFSREFGLANTTSLFTAEYNKTMSLFNAMFSVFVHCQIQHHFSTNIQYLFSLPNSTIQHLFSQPNTTSLFYNTANC